MKLITQRSLIKDYLSDAESFWDEWRKKSAKEFYANTCTKSDVIKALGNESALDVSLPTCDECESTDKQSYMQFDAQYGHDCVILCGDCIAKAGQTISEAMRGDK